MKLVKNNSIVFDSCERLILNAPTGPVRDIEARMILGFNYITHRGIIKEIKFINDNNKETGIIENKMETYSWSQHMFKKVTESVSFSEAKLFCWRYNVPR